MSRLRNFVLALTACLLAGHAFAGTGSDTFIRGDSNSDAMVDIGDAIFTLDYLFSAGADPACLDASDANDDGTTDIGDAIYSLDFLFSSGPVPPAPYPTPGVDPTADGVICGTPCTDVWYADVDEDGFGDDSDFIVDCAPSGIYTASVGGDCEPLDDEVNPDAEEICGDGIDNDCDGQIDESDCTGGAAATSAQIQAARDTVDGPTMQLIENALITYVKPEIGNDPAGFFIQAEQAGPALFIAVDPATIVPTPVVGDSVTFEILEMATSFGTRQASIIDGYILVSAGNDVTFLIQNLNTVDFVTALDDYESELISVDLTVTDSFASAGFGFVSAPADTATIVGSPDLRVRLPVAIVDDLLLTSGCTLSFASTPLWRFNAQAQPSGWVESDFVVDSCPPFQVLGAAALSGTEVQVTLDHNLDAGTVLSDGSQFSIPGLTILGASVTGNLVVLDTDLQTGGTSYTVTVDGTVVDTFGGTVDPSADSASFLGFVTPAEVRINELNGNIPDGCDLIELRVISGGSMEGFMLMERTGTLLTFTGLTVATNDYIVVHFDGNDVDCNPGASGNETAATDEFASLDFPQNYDTAYDWYTTDSGMTNTDNVITLLDGTGAIVDAVLVSDDVTGTAAAASEAQAAVVAAAGEWTTVAGTIPVGGFVDDDFNAHAVQDLSETGTTPVGDSIHRSDDADTNHLGGWTLSPSSWGANNPGQLDF